MTTDSGMKIFGVGLNRTGTLTLHHALTQLGFSGQHWVGRNYHRFQSGDIAGLLKLADRYDALTDWPWPLMLGELVERYGDSARFVLTVRADADIWLRSFANHAAIHASPAACRMRESLFGFATPLMAPRRHKEFYEQHNAAVHAFFRSQGLEHNLLEVCWEQGDGWGRLCQFLDRPEPLIKFPHQNQLAAANSLGQIGQNIRRLTAGCQTGHVRFDRVAPLRRRAAG